MTRSRSPKESTPETLTRHSISGRGRRCFQRRGSGINRSQLLYKPRMAGELHCADRNGCNWPNHDEGLLSALRAVQTWADFAPKGCYLSSTSKEGRGRERSFKIFELNSEDPQQAETKLVEVWRSHPDSAKMVALALLAQRRTRLHPLPRKALRRRVRAREYCCRSITHRQVQLSSSQGC